MMLASRFIRRLLLVILIVPLMVMITASRQISGAVAVEPIPESRSGTGEPGTQIFLPVFLFPPDLTKPLPPPIPAAGTPPINYSAIQADLKSKGKDLAFNKIGFHVGPGGNRDGLGDWMQSLDAAGVPFFLKSVDDPGPLLEAQALMVASGVPHTLVFRLSTHGQNDGYQYDVPNYTQDPVTAANVHWNAHLAKFPAGLDPQNVWLETVNEVDKNNSEWLAQFSLETARLALRDGYRWAAFSWSSGEPEPEAWESPYMLQFLRFISQHPDRLAIALHEYSYTADDIGAIYPWLVGRFQILFQVCDEHNLNRPTVLITEWGWEYEHVPDPTQAMADIQWAAWLYSAFPEVRGAAIWYLGPNFGGVADEAQKLIAPVKDYSLANYFEIVPGPGKIEPSLLAP